MMVLWQRRLHEPIVVLTSPRQSSEVATATARPRLQLIARVPTPSRLQSRHAMRALQAAEAAALAEHGALSAERAAGCGAPAFADAVVALHHRALDEAAHAFRGRGGTLSGVCETGLRRRHGEGAAQRALVSAAGRRCVFGHWRCLLLAFVFRQKGFEVRFAGPGC